ncbi:hypothetical protein Q5P01_008382 [Channa striata]|uniref:Uncharacterized protein n=1 Tax=Channa striata TaxID=64152 RepID=A0AA88NE14_CHASR|nr:hypothetical protein Q5P01_008382 [Channa striata]
MFTRRIYWKRSLPCQSPLRQRSGRTSAASGRRHYGQTAGHFSFRKHPLARSLSYQHVQERETFSQKVVGSGQRRSGNKI